MTKLKFTNAPRWRETDVVVRDGRTRTLAVALQPTALLLRLKGTRTVYTLPLQTAYLRAVHLAADAARESRKSRTVRKRGAL